MQTWKTWRFMTPARILVVGFALLSFLGAILLSLPIASESGEGLPFLDALFTATSAVCVTGLVVVDTGTYFSKFGEIVILSLVQIGGLGFMTVATFVTIFTGKKIGLKERLLIQESLNVSSLEGLIRLTRNVVLITVAIEMFFAALLAIRFATEMPVGQAIYYGVFHAITAFCNAGFDLFGDYKSLADFVGDPTVLLPIMSLIIIGGLGFTVLVDIGRKISKRDRVSLHTKLVVIATAVLLVVGTLGYYGLEGGNQQTLGTLSEGDKWLGSAFSSTTARTAGFAAINYETITDSGKLWTIFLMFIGGGPGSTAGGLKTVTAFVILLYLWTVISNKEQTVIFKRAIAPRLIYKALVISIMFMMLVVFATFILTITEQKPFLSLLFEVVSAASTTGLSANVTPTLSPVGECVIIAMMYIGRLGPLTIALALAARTQDKGNVRYPDGNLYVG